MLVKVVLLSLIIWRNCSGKVLQDKAKRYEVSLPLLGILMCKDKCVNSAGCVSYDFNRLQLLCKLLSYVGGEYYKIPPGVIFEGLVSCFVDKGHKRICVSKNVGKSFTEKEPLAKEHALTEKHHSQKRNRSRNKSHSERSSNLHQKNHSKRKSHSHDKNHSNRKSHSQDKNHSKRKSHSQDKNRLKGKSHSQDKNRLKRKSHSHDKNRLKGKSHSQDKNHSKRKSHSQDKNRLKGKSHSQDKNHSNRKSHSHDKNHSNRKSHSHDKNHSNRKSHSQDKNRLKGKSHSQDKNHSKRKSHSQDKNHSKRKSHSQDKNHSKRKSHSQDKNRLKGKSHSQDKNHSNRKSHSHDKNHSNRKSHSHDKNHSNRKSHSQDKNRLKGKSHSQDKNHSKRKSHSQDKNHSQMKSHSLRRGYSFRKITNLIVSSRFLVASLYYNLTYYTFTVNALHVIRGQKRKGCTTFNEQTISPFYGSRGILSGMASAPCLDNIQVHCLYYLHYDTDALTANHSLTLLYHLEPGINYKRNYLPSSPKSTFLRCPEFYRSFIAGIILDLKVNLYVLHLKMLYRFDHIQEEYTRCKLVRPILNGPRMRTMQLDERGYQLSLLTDYELKVYDVTKWKEGGQLVLRVALKQSYIALYCMETHAHQRRIVVISKRNLTAVTFCYIRKSTKKLRCG